VGFFVNNYLFIITSIVCLKINHTFVNMKWLGIVAKHHKEYVSIVNGFGEHFYAEDIVQETYLRILKYCKPEAIITNGNVNKSYVYFVLRNMYIDFQKYKAKHPKVSIEEIGQLEGEAYNVEKHECYEEIIKLVNNEVEGWHWYDKMLFDLYKKTGKSIRELSKETTISTKSIFQTLKHCKERLKENVGEDYEDYKNKDYELILKKWQEEKNKLKGLATASNKF
jgi:RNA polymerase sigma factor (sigma-70 family)